jgi:hypothetical protein
MRARALASGLGLGKGDRRVLVDARLCTRCHFGQSVAFNLCIWAALGLCGSLAMLLSLFRFPRVGYDVQMPTEGRPGRTFVHSNRMVIVEELLVTV